MAHKFDHPTEGEFPALHYTFVTDTEHHVFCDCGSYCRTSDEKVARHFARVHTGDHAARRIITPPTPEEP